MQVPHGRLWMALVISAIVLFLFTASTVRADPSVTCKCPSCAPSCSSGCPKGTVGVSVSMASVDSTNVTAKVTVNVNATVYFYWGNTTAYGYTLLNGVRFSSSDLSNSYFVDYIEPSTTYYYEVEASTSCYSTGTTTGSWTTPSDSATAITGTVNDSGGANAPSEFTIYASCGTPSSPDVWFGDTDTSILPSGKSYFSLSTTDACVLAPGVTYTVVAAADDPSFFPGVWYNHWNESVVIWGPQVVNFVLPLNYATGEVPDFVDYSNAPANYTSLSQGAGEGYENAYTYSWSVGAQVIGIGGGASGSTTSSTLVSENVVLGTTLGNLCYAVEYYVTGMIEFTGMTRAWSFLQTLIDPHNGDFCDEIPHFQTPADWIHNATGNGAYLMDGPSTSKWNGGLEDVPLWEGNFISYSLTISTTTSTVTGVNYGFQLSGTLAGVLPLSFQASEGWSQEVSSSTSTTLSYEIMGPGSGVSCYNVFGEGGSQSLNTADMIAIFYWTGSVVNGGPVCT